MVNDARRDGRWCVEVKTTLRGKWARENLQSELEEKRRSRMIEWAMSGTMDGVAMRAAM